MKPITKVLSAALLAAAVTVTTAAELKWSGAAQYRGRLDIDLNKDVNGKSEDAVLNRHNKYAWKLGLKASVSENLGFGFQLENGDGYIMTGTVSSNGKFGDGTKMVESSKTEGEYNFKNTNNLIRVTQAYMAVKKGVFHTNMGIIPVAGNTTLDMAYHLENVGLGVAPEMTEWAVFMANSQTGAEIGFDISDNVGINLVAATQMDDGKLVAGEEEDENAKDDMRFYLNAPIKLGNATLTPALNVTSGIEDSWTSLSTAGGLDVKVKASDAVTISGGVAVGGYGVGDQPISILGMVKPTFKIGEKSNLTTGLSYGWGQNRVAGDNAYSVNNLYADVKYGISPLKNFTVMPRVRVWHKFDTQEDNDATKTKIRPEILFIASF